MKEINYKKVTGAVTIGVLAAGLVEYTIKLGAAWYAARKLRKQIEKEMKKTEALAD